MKLILEGHARTWMQVLLIVWLTVVTLSESTSSADSTDPDSLTAQDHVYDSSSSRTVEDHVADSSDLTPIEGHLSDISDQTTDEGHLFDSSVKTTDEGQSTDSSDQTTDEGHLSDSSVKTTVEGQPTDSSDQTTDEGHLSDSSDKTTVEGQPTYSSDGTRKDSSYDVIIDASDEINIVDSARPMPLSSGGPHPCLRECIVGARPMRCFYKFEVEDYFSMSKACYNCPSNSTDCGRPDCVPADGAKRSLMVVNRQLPGPSINVCHDDVIIVDVINQLVGQSVTIHWHGIHQVGTPYMDGVPFVTQCPLVPQSSFRYQFKANPAGTYFWHSHLGVQRADGLFGALIVRLPTKQDPNKHTFDEDLPSHTLQILDWDHVSSMEKFLAHYHAGGDNKPPTLLVNGRGFNYASSDPKLHVPLARFDVKQGVRYRFRLINAGFLNCPIQLSVDNHNITIIASDSSLLQPVEAESLVSYAGERFDFVISATQPVSNYWVRLRGLMDCDDNFRSAHQVAVLHYHGASDADPTGEVSYQAAKRQGLQVNTANVGSGKVGSLVISDLNSAMPDDVRLKPKADVTFYVEYDFYALDNPLFQKHSLYSVDTVVRKDERSTTPQLNYISMKLPPAPLLSQLHDLDHRSFCNGSSVRSRCRTQYCECTHILKVKLGDVVELAIIDQGVTPKGNHPFHLHGTDFRVIAMGLVGPNTTSETVKALDQSGRIKRKLKMAPIKDVVTIPHGGYTIVRFRATNPGFWMFHCHIDFHSEIGMALVFQFGKPKNFPRVPKGFPKCGTYTSLT